MDFNTKFKRNKGITLIALVVTIIVLLILAGISIMMLTGQNGILNRANQAKERTQQAQEYEQTAINNTSDFINSYVNGKSYEVVEPTNVEDWVFTTESDGTITITKYKGSDTEVVIPNFINGVAVKRVGSTTGTDDTAYTFGYPILPGNGDTVHRGGSEDWYHENKSVTKITVSEGIEVIGAYAFSAANALTEIKLPESLKQIYNYAFYYTKSLDNITIPNNVEKVDRDLFCEAGSITVNVPFEEGRQPSGWNADWNNGTDSDTIIINYKK